MSKFGFGYETIDLIEVIVSANLNKETRTLTNNDPILKNSPEWILKPILKFRQFWNFHTRLLNSMFL